MEDNKESSTAVTAPTTPIISPAQTANNYDEETGLGGRQATGDGTNNAANNNDSGNGKGSEDTLQSLNLNSYATKKTVAQAILDLALLAANASQLKYILSVGEKHEFYQIILWLVVTSIILQVIQAIICIILALVLNINEVDEQKAADIVNNICLVVVVLIVVVNVIITGFDMKGTEDMAIYRKNT